MSDLRTGLPVRLFDEDNLAYTQNNPLPVSLEESEGDEIHDFNEATAVLKNGGSADHVYTVSAGKEFLVTKVLISGSGRAKYEFQIETGVATDLYETVAVGFVSTASLSSSLDFGKVAKKAIAGVRFKVVKTNLDNQDQSLYSTIVGVEK